MEAPITLPILPPGARQAHEAGELLLFCGAGVSMPSFPDMSGLVEDVYRRLPEDLSREEQAASNLGAYDRTLHLLEQRVGRTAVRRAVLDIFKKEADPQPIHRALIHLARDQGGRIRLVTTNFDQLFERAADGLRPYSAPSLPPARSDRWTGLVHLHGVIDPIHDPDGEHLVLTSADFGRAYFIERWASRFLAGILEQYSVLFVGYSASDVLVRYALDALSVESTKARARHALYAFAPIKPGKTSAEVELEWSQRGVIPICYSITGSEHPLLTQCLERWVDRSRFGLTSKRSTVARLCSLNHQSIPKEDLADLVWALSDPSGAPAKELVAAGGKPQAPFDWIALFEREGLLGHCQRDGSERQISLVGRSHVASAAPPLDARTSAFAAWLVAHRDDPRLLDWILERGGDVHGELAERLADALGRENLANKALGDAWAIFLDPATNGTRSRNSNLWDLLRLAKDVVGQEPSTTVMARLAEALAPCGWLAIPLGRRAARDALKVSRQLSGESDEATAEEARSLRDYLEVTLGLRCGDHHHVVEKALVESKHRDAWIGGLCFSVEHHLERALELSEHVYAMPGYPLHEHVTDHQVVHIRGIAPGEHRHPWTLLVRLAWSGFEVLDQHDPVGAKLLYSFWLRSKQTVLRRLALEAARRGKCLSTAERVRAVLEGNRPWLWEPYVEVELLKYLGALRKTIAAKYREALVAAILNVPNGEPNPDSDRLKVRETQQLKRLLMLERAGVPLGDTATIRLGELRNRHQEWEKWSGPEHIQSIAARLVGEGGIGPEEPPEDLTGLTDAELATRFSRTPGNASVNARLADLAQKEPMRVFGIMEQALASGMERGKS